MVQSCCTICSWSETATVCMCDKREDKERRWGGKEGARRDNKEKIYVSVTQVTRKLAGDVVYRIASVFSGRKQLICSYTSGVGKCSLSSSPAKYNTGSPLPTVWLTQPRTFSCQKCSALLFLY